MGQDKQRGTVEQVRRAFEFLRYPFTAINPMPPPYPDVRVITPSGPIAVEATEVNWGAGPKGSPTRQMEDAAIRAGVVSGFWAKADPTPGVVQAVESKCGKRYRLDNDEDLWLLLLGGSSAAPASTFVFTRYLNLAELTSQTHALLAQSGFARCYLFCELTERGSTLHGWDRIVSWRQIDPAG